MNHLRQRTRALSAATATAPALLALLGAVLIAGCAAVPARDAITIAETAQAAIKSEPSTAFVLLVHGSGSSPREWPADFIDMAYERPPGNANPTAAASGIEAPVDWIIVAFDWEETAARRLTAPRRGYAIGRALGEGLVSARQSRIVIVAHSVGAHVAQGVIDGYRETGGRARVDLVLLDPFLPRGVLRWRWGEAHFGLGADRALNYYVRGDGVPGTDRPVVYAENRDLTNDVPSRHWNQTGAAHYWVARYFAEVIGVDLVASGLP